MRQGFWTSRVHLYDKGVLFHQRNPCQRCTKRCQQDLSVAARWKKTQRPKGFENLTCFAQLFKCTSVWKICWTCSSTGNSSNLSTVPFTKSDKPLQTPTFWNCHKVTNKLSRFFSTAGSLVPLQIDSPFIPSQLPPPSPGDTSLVVSSHLPAATKPRPRCSDWWYAACMEHQCPVRYARSNFGTFKKPCPNLESRFSEWRVFRISTLDLKKNTYNNTTNHFNPFLLDIYVSSYNLNCFLQNKKQQPHALHRSTSKMRTPCGPSRGAATCRDSTCRTKARRKFCESKKFRSPDFWFAVQITRNPLKSPESYNSSSVAKKITKRWPKNFWGLHQALKMEFPWNPKLHPCDSIGSPACLAADCLSVTESFIGLRKNCENSLRTKWTQARFQIPPVE